MVVQIKHLVLVLVNGLTLYIFHKGLLHLNSAEGLFGYSMVCR